MARFPALVSVLTDLDGRRDRSTIANIVRAMREDGLLPVSGKGYLAAPVTLRDAASVVLGVNVMEGRGEAASVVRELRAMRMNPASAQEHPILHRLVEAPNFGAAVEVLIEEAAALEVVLKQWADRVWSSLPDNSRSVFVPQVIVGFTSNFQGWIEIRFGNSPGIQDMQPDFKLSYNPDFFSGEERFFLPKSARTVTVELGFQVFLAVHRLLHPHRSELAAGRTKARRDDVPAL